MFSHCQLVILMLALTLDGQVQAVIGGHESVPHSRPYMVLLERSGHGGRGYCAGFLLNEDFVMSAAHCKAESYTVLLGLHDVRNSLTVQRIEVDQMFVYDDYDETSYNNDVMLLKLSSKVKFNKNVRPIRLACRDSSSVPKSCIVSGWGSTSNNNRYMSHKLMEVNVTLINSSECHQEDSYCSKGDVGPNRGDGGGPLVCEDGKAYGVVSSFLPTNSGGPLIQTYTKIPDKRAWITFIICNALL